MSGATRQSGAALLVAIIMIFALTLLGTSAMRGANLERRIAENAIQSSLSFQVAESAGELLLNERANLRRAFEQNGTPLEVDTGIEPGEGIAARAVVRYVGDGPALGYSLGAGSNTYMVLRFEVDSVAEIDTVRARASVSQGAGRVVPAP